MFDILNEIVYWHWLIFGAILILLEMLAPGALFLWPGLAAVLVGLINALAPDLPWTVTVTAWAILSIVTAFGWRAYRQKNPAKSEGTAQTLNQRGSQYIGRHFTLTKPIINGSGELKVDDTIWKAISDDDLPGGSRVTVIAVEGTSLRVSRRS